MKDNFGLLFLLPLIFRSKTDKIIAHIFSEFSVEIRNLLTSLKTDLADREVQVLIAAKRNELFANENRLLVEKINATGVEKNNLMNEIEISVSTIDDMQVSMDEMKSRYE